MKNYYYKGNPNNDIDIEKIYKDEIKSHTILSQEETVELIKKAQNGDIDARNEVVEHNLKLAYYVVKHFAMAGMPFLDAIQIGNETIINCVYNYDINSNNKFSSYLSESIIYNIRKIAVKSKNVMSFSYSSNAKVGKISKFCDDFYMRNEREATQEEIIKELKVTKRDVKLYYDIKNNNLSISLDSIPYEGDESEGKEAMYNLIGYEDENYNVVLSRLTRERIIEEINNMNVKEKDKNIILYRYGFVDGKSHTLRELANMFDLSRARVDQIDTKMIMKMRKSKKFNRDMI